jgi:hypothetical protein
MGGCHGDEVGGACARLITNLLRLGLGVASICPPSPLTYEVTNAQTSHVTAFVARRGGTAQKQTCCRLFSGRAVTSAKGLYTRYDTSDGTNTSHPPSVADKKERDGENRQKGVRKFFFTELIFSRLVYFCITRHQCAKIVKCFLTRIQCIRLT